MTERFDLQRFDGWDALVDAAVGVIAAALTNAVLERGRATAALSGGSTPGDIYRLLARQALPWRRITATLTDERWVDASSPDSNARLLRETLLQNKAARAALLPLKPGDAGTPEDAAAETARALAPHLPLDAVLLGMGADGHVASLFPGSPALAAGSAPDAASCIAVPAGRPAPPQPRLSLSLPVLLEARRLLLVIRGPEKLDLLQEAASTEESGVLPVSMLLRQAPTPVRVLWAP